MLDNLMCVQGIEEVNVFGWMSTAVEPGGEQGMG